MLSLMTNAPLHKRIAIEGQSNAMGVAAQSEISAAPLSSDSGLATFAAGTFARVFVFNATSGNYEHLKLGTNNDAYTASTFGPEFGLAVRWMRETTRGNLYIDKHYGDGQPISYFQNGGAFFTAAQSRKIAQDAWLTANNIRSMNVGLLWVQGESDSAQTQSYYQTALDTYVNSRISAGLMRSTAKRLFPQILPGTTSYSAAVNAAKTAYVAANPTTSAEFSYANHLNGDNLHLNAQGQLQLGYDAFERFFSKPHLTA